MMSATGFGFSIAPWSIINGILVEVDGYGDGVNALRRGLTVVVIAHWLI